VSTTQHLFAHGPPDLWRAETIEAQRSAFCLAQHGDETTESLTQRAGVVLARYGIYREPISVCWLALQVSSFQETVG